MLLPGLTQLISSEWHGALNMCSRSLAKSRDDIMALMHVTYTKTDALPLQQDIEL